MIYVYIYLWGFSNTLSHSNAYFLINRVKKEHSVYIPKRSAAGGGPPPTPPRYTPLAAAASLLMENELAYAEKQYDSAVSQPDILILQERDIEWIDAENVEDPPALPDIFTASPPSPSPGPSNPSSGVPSPTPTPDPRPLPPKVSPSTSQPREGKKRKLSTDRKECYANINSRQEELHKAQLGLTEETQHQLRETCSAVREAAKEAQHAFASIANDSKRWLMKWYHF
ncbi:uncharacterized protein [Penaeus vannamei]|uniref:uncharacterized protein n=1 Tax=Penaeus vannamei TaxID=6689 RepID=UPI00387F850B